AFRFGLNVGFNEDKQDGVEGQAILDPPYYPTPTMNESDIDGHQEAHTYAVFVHLIHEFPVRDRVAIFGEIGPAFRYSRSKYLSEYVYGYSSPVFVWSDERRIERTAAMDLALGFEWFVSKRISLGARYGAFAGYKWGGLNYDRGSNRVDGTGYQREYDNRDTKGVVSGTSRATVTLAAYF
ncbi:MAG TPA: hypothetical protein VFU59_04725, partial [Candidatus Eisenbacteria bacterium]|nr:hypothetical protein [Candidatus Eisenbacteria bacterium]